MSEHTTTQNKHDDSHQSIKNDSEMSTEKKEKVFEKDIMSNRSAQSPVAVDSITNSAGSLKNFAIIVFGGILAGFVGFAVGISDRVISTSNEEETLRSSLLEIELSNRLTELEQTVQIISDRYEDFLASANLPVMSAQVDANSEQMKAVSTLSDRLHTLESQVEDMLNTFDVSIPTADTMASIDRDLTALKASLTQQKQDLEVMFSEALQREEMASKQLQKATAQVSAAKLLESLNAGQNISNYIGELESLGIDVANAISTKSNGVVTLQALQTDFPSLARETLKAARESSETDGFWDFLKHQVNMRSVTPQDGNSLDAILSRAESKLKHDDVESALAELQALPETAKAKFSPWLEKAEKRVNAISAASELLDQIRAQ